jgi:hypothetical protein
MHSSPIKRSTMKAGVAAASAFAAVGVLLVAPVSGASATAVSAEAPFSRRCFMERPVWNVALDGPVPQCPGPKQAADEAVAQNHTRPSPGGDWVGGLVRPR